MKPNTQAKNQEVNFEEILYEITLETPPESIFHLFVREARQMNKNEENFSKFCSSHKFYKEWRSLSKEEKQKYENQLNAKEEKFKRDLELVGKHLIKKPIEIEEAAFKLFEEYTLKTATENKNNLKSAKQQADEEWKTLCFEDRMYWEMKTEEFKNLLEKAKDSKKSINSYLLFLKDQLYAAKMKGIQIFKSEIDHKWRNLKPYIKEKYTEYATELKQEIDRNRKIYENSYELKLPLAKSYQLFLGEKRKKDKNLTLTQIGQLWKSLPVSEKEVYKRMEHKSLLIYRYKKFYIQKNSLSTKSLTGNNLLKIFQKPKPLGTIYNMWFPHIFRQLRKNHPNLSANECLKKASIYWKEVSQEEKDELGNLLERKREEYKNNLKEWEEKGYYTQNKQQIGNKRPCGKVSPAENKKKKLK